MTILEQIEQRSLAAFVTVFRSAPPTVEARATGDSLQLVLQFLVRPSFGRPKGQVVAVESGVPCFIFSAEHRAGKPAPESPVPPCPSG
jgi:hypothetical protein